jgi:hypothetical protein
MPTYQVRLESVKIQLPELVAEVSPIIRDVHSGLTRRIADRARTVTAPIRTGHLRSQIREDQHFFSGLLTMYGGVTSHADYSAPVHEGARPHPIVPVRARALAFFWERIGEHVVFARVNHPGNKPNRFLVRAVREVLASDPRIQLRPGFAGHGDEPIR